MLELNESTNHPHVAVTQSIVVCPICHGDLNGDASAIRCTLCLRSFPQQSAEWIDLLPVEMIRDRAAWERRQREMEEWYKDLVADPLRASASYNYEFGAFSDFLQTYSGSILDLGGGNGVARHFLRGKSRYVVLDPSTSWLDTAWDPISESFPCLRKHPAFVKGIGEFMPFADRAFDVVLAIFSLNHVNEPGRVLAEVDRVLRPGGTLFLVMEDMEPSWGDLADPFFRRMGRRKLARVAAEKALSALRIRSWPVQEDHIRIREAELTRWTAEHFSLKHRSWRIKYLCFEFQKSMQQEA